MRGLLRALVGLGGLVAATAAQAQITISGPTLPVCTANVPPVYDVTTARYVCATVSLSATGILTPTGTYVNWGPTTGESGYGLRATAGGQVQFKDSGGAWTALAAGAATNFWARSGTQLDVATAGDTLAALTIGGAGAVKSTKITLGLTISQGAYDDAVLAFKSSDVAHPMTDLADADSYGQGVKYSPSSGGLAWRGFTEDAIALSLGGYAVNANTTKSSSGLAAVLVRGLLRSGTTAGDMSANAGVFGIRNNATTVAITDAEGDTWQAGAIAASGVGPYAFGGASSPDVQWYKRGTFTTASTNVYGDYDTRMLVPTTTGNVYAYWIDPVLRTNNGQTHAVAGVVDIRPALVSVDSGTSTVTNAFGLRVQAPTAGSGVTLVNPYALWVDSGLVRLDGPTQTTVGAAGGASALPATPSGYLEIAIEGTRYVIPYFAKS